MSIEARLTELESRMAHQDQAINDLSKEIYAQQKQIERLETTCKRLVEQSGRPRDGIAGDEDEPPPHY